LGGLGDETRRSISGAGEELGYPSGVHKISMTKRNGGNGQEGEEEKEGSICVK
jgi:hypothetical protein